MKLIKHHKTLSEARKHLKAFKKDIRKSGDLTEGQRYKLDYLAILKRPQAKKRGLKYPYFIGTDLDGYPLLGGCWNSPVYKVD